jgi:TetR/AcrR family transcriptional regulator
MAVLNHFDRIHTNRGFQSLMQQEMIRLHRGEDNALSPLVDKIFRPLMRRMQQVLEEGIASGELIDTDPTQIRYAAMGANVFYFMSAPLIQMIDGGDLLSWRALEFRRSSAIRYLGLTIFTYRRHGESVAERVLDTTPMPEHNGIEPLPMPGFRAKKSVRAVPVMVYPDEQQAKADSSASLRNDKQIGLQQFGNRFKKKSEVRHK